MTTLEFAPYTSEDNIVELSAEEQAEYNYKSESLAKFNSQTSLIEFSCPTTLEQLWNEIDNLTDDNDKRVKNAKDSALKYLTPGKYDNLLHVYSKPRCGLEYSDIFHVERAGDLVLGVTCENSGPVEIHVGGVLKFTKECNAGFNVFSRDEVIPMIALVYHAIRIHGQYVSNVIYGTILHADLRKQLVDFYAMPNNPSMYVVQSGIDIGVKKNQEKINPSNLIIVGSNGMNLEQFMKHLKNEGVIKTDFKPSKFVSD